ncbi:MAG: shufflon system plasmid conjugative transfer pilus tip adhesin PilV [Bacteroidota bacterium]
MKNLSKTILTFSLFFGAFASKAQNVGIGTNTPVASAKLEISSTNSGILIPRVALVNVTNNATPVAAPATGLMVYNTNAAVTGGSGTGFYFWDGSVWSKLASGTQAYWSLLGNAGTAAATNFIGTTDAIDFVTRTNNTEKMRVTSAGNVGIGTATPAYRLDLANGTFGFGTSNVRTETRDNAGLQGNAGAQSGFFETSAPVNYPAGAASWWHLIDTRHSNPANNYALQIAGSFFDQELWFRKTNSSATTAWTRLLSTGNINTYAWSILGNSGTVAATNFIGTTDAVDFVTRTSNTERMRVTAAGNVGIGTNAPAESFSVVRAQGGWQARFNNSSGTGADVYVAHGGGYGMHIRGWNASDAVYTLEMYNNTALTNAFYNSGRVVLGMVGNVGVGVATPVYKFQTNGDIYANGGWFRVSGNQGYYFETYGGGWQMTDATWLRTYNAKPILATGGVAGYGNNPFGAPFGANPRFYANYDNAGGGGESISDDGGFYDYNDAWITFRGSQGLKIKHNVGGSDLMQFDMLNIGGALADRYVNSSNDNWGYVGINGRAWYRMYSYGFVTASVREKKKDITAVTDNVSDLVMIDIDRLNPYLYRYKNETTEWVSGQETKCQPNFHLGLILDEAPDYVQDNAFGGVDIYSVATLGIVAAKSNREDIKEIKEELGMTNGSIKKISDFGAVELSNGEFFVDFDTDFSKQLNGSVPVITLSVNQINVSATIVNKSATGFKVQISGVNNEKVSLDYIAMAKVTVNVHSKSIEELEQAVPQEVLNGMRVTDASKLRVKEFWENQELEQKERERKAAEEAIIIQQQRKAEIDAKTVNESPSPAVDKQNIGPR